MKHHIDYESIRLLRFIFADRQTWSTRPDPEAGRDRSRRYDVFFPYCRQSSWGLGARLKVRRVPEHVWERGALLGVYRVGNAEKGSSCWQEWPSLVLYPLPADYDGTPLRLGWSGPRWVKNGTLAAGPYGGRRWFDFPRDDPRYIHIICPGTSGRCSIQFVLGPAGGNVTFQATFPRAAPAGEIIQLE